MQPAPWESGSGERIDGRGLGIRPGGEVRVRETDAWFENGKGTDPVTTFAPLVDGKKRPASPIPMRSPPSRPCPEIAPPSADHFPPAVFSGPSAGYDLASVAVHPFPAGLLARPFERAGRACPVRVQAKLVVGEPDDEYEYEADRAAEQVMRMPEDGSTPRRCSACDQDEEESLQRKAFSGHPSSAAGFEAPSIVQEVLRSPGEPLDAETRQTMETRFNWDFGRVKVHTDSRADRSAKAVHAIAYTVGQDMVFASGRFAPGTSAGRKLIAHELAHTIQQGREPGRPEGSDRPAVGTGRPGGDRPKSGIAPDSAPRLRPGHHSVLQRGGPEEEPLIPMPVFDEFDPVIIVPDIEGMPDFLRGAQVPISALRSALNVLRGRIPGMGGSEDTGFCERILPGYERARSGPQAGQCCPRFRRDPDLCCGPDRMALMANRCCRRDEVVMPDGTCFRPERAPIPPVRPIRPPPPPPPPPESGPAPAPVPVPVPVEIYFNFDRPRPGESGRSAFASSATAEGLLNFAGLVDQLTDNPDFRVQLVGRASPEGEPPYNLNLGARRARMVRQALIDAGISGSRIIDPPTSSLESGCRPLGSGMATCGEIGSTGDRDRQVYARVFSVGTP